MESHDAEFPEHGRTPVRRPDVRPVTSARDYLMGVIDSHIDGPHAANLIDTYRAEVLREAAARIRAELPERTKKLTGKWASITTVSTAQQAADLIDPDKQ